MLYSDHAYSFGWNGKLFNIDDLPLPKEKFKWNWYPIRRIPKSFKEECIISARIILEKSNDIYCFVSGGIDSEVMILSFLENNFKPKLVSTKFKNSINEIDILNIIEISKKYDLELILLDLDLEEYFLSNIEHLIAKYHTTFIHAMIHAWMLEQIDYGFPVFGCGPIGATPTGPKNNYKCYLEYKNEKIFVTEQTYYNPMYKILNDQNRDGCPRFFTYTPELIYSYINHPIMVAYEKAYPAVCDYIQSLEDIRPIIYHQEWEILKPRKKQTGIEKFVNNNFTPNWSIIEKICLRQNPNNGTYFSLEFLRKSLEGKNV